MTRIKISFDTPTQEFEIAGKVYVLDYSDDKLREYLIIRDQFLKESKEAERLDVDSMSVEEQMKIERKYTETMRITLDAFFGEGAFDKIYSDTGRHMLNVAKVIGAVMDFIEGKFSTLKKEKRKKYTRAG
jgi:hypothetical protein